MTNTHVTKAHACLFIILVFGSPGLLLVLLGCIIYTIANKISFVALNYTVHSPYRYPIAFDEAIRALKTSKHGLDSWFIAYQNTDEGQIQAKLKYTTHHEDRPSEQNQIVLEIFLTPVEGTKTEIEFEFDVESAANSLSRDRIVANTAKALKAVLDESSLCVGHHSMDAASSPGPGPGI